MQANVFSKWVLLIWNKTKNCGDIETINIFKVSPTNNVPAPPPLSPRMTRDESFSSHDGEVAPTISAIFGLVHTKAQFWVELKKYFNFPKRRKSSLAGAKRRRSYQCRTCAIWLGSDINSILTSLMSATIISKDNGDKGRVKKTKKETNGICH